VWQARGGGVAMSTLHAMSKTGLTLCALYALGITVCIALVFLGDGDPKGRYVLLQVPIALQSALVVGIGMAPLLEDISWLAAYALLAGPVFVLLYTLGSAIDRSRRTSTTARMPDRTA
jgi:hypothetical protein